MFYQGEMEFGEQTVDWRALRSQNWQSRLEAVARLGSHQGKGQRIHPDVMVALRASFKDEHWQVRRQAAYTLQKLGKDATHEALPVLWQACADKDSCVRAAAVSVLELYGQGVPPASLRHSKLNAQEESWNGRPQLDILKEESTYDLKEEATDKANSGTATTEEGLGFRTDSEEVFPYRSDGLPKCHSDPSDSHGHQTDDKGRPPSRQGISLPDTSTSTWAKRVIGDQSNDNADMFNQIIDLIDDDTSCVAREGLRHGVEDKEGNVEADVNLDGTFAITTSPPETVRLMQNGRRGSSVDGWNFTTSGNIVTTDDGTVGVATGPAGARRIVWNNGATYIEVFTVVSVD